jgi:O-antigen/teichoic acid export membrane protein
VTNLNKLKGIKNKILEDAHFFEVLKKGGGAFLFKIFGAGLAFLFTIYFARLLGPDDYGIFILSLTIVTVLSVIVRMGLDVVLMKNIAVAMGRKEYAAARGYHQSVTHIVIYASAFVTLFVVLTLPYVSDAFFWKQDFSRQLSHMIWCLLPLSLMMLNVEALRGLREITTSVMVQNIIVPGSSLLMLLILGRWYSWNLDGVVYIYVISIIIASIYSRWCWNNRIHVGDVIKQKKLQLIEKGFPLLLASSGGLVMSWTDTLVLGVYGSSENVGVYSVAAKTAMLTSIVLFAVNSISAPKYAAFFAANNIKGIARLARQSTLFMLALVLVPSLVFLLWPQWILKLYGVEYSVGATVLLILTVGQLINVACGSVGYILMTSGHEKIVRNIMMTTALINVFLNIQLVQVFGIEGVAISTMVSVAIWNIWMLLSVKKYLGFWTFYNSY